MSKKLMSLCVLLLCIYPAAAKNSLATENAHIPQSSPVSPLLLQQLASAKGGGDALAVAATQTQINNMIGVMPVASHIATSEIYELRHIPAAVGAKSFGSDFLLAASEYNESAPAIATASDSAIFAAYEARDGSHAHKFIGVAKSSDGGATWIPLIAIVNDSYDLNYPQIAVGEGEQDWVFVSYHTAGNELEVARFSFSGAGGETRTIGGIWDGKRNARIVVDNDPYYYVYLAYISAGMWDTDVHFARSTDFGVTWMTLDFTSQGELYCDIAYLSSGRLAIVAQTSSGETGAWVR